MKKIVVLTGAGMSADSGLSTFRDSGGMWEKYDINEVASIEGWHKNPKKVLDFYNARRKQLEEVAPNEGHKALANLEKSYEVQIITQNVDDLHERAGSSNVLHLHGELTKAKSETDPQNIIDIGTKSIEWGDEAPDGGQLRPHVVWFGEMVPMMSRAMSLVPSADIFIVIGTSLSVYPAAGLVNYTDESMDRYYIDPSTSEVSLNGWRHIKERASVGTPELATKLLNAN